VPAGLAFGGAFHAAAEHHYRELLEGKPAPTLDALLSAYNDAWHEHDDKLVQFGKDDDRGTLNDLASRMLAAFQSSEVASPAGTINRMPDTGRLRAARRSGPSSSRAECWPLGT
jgi:putative RecB family exonuclease